MHNVHSDCDILVIGGGINGAGIARDAAGRGFKVILCEQHDLAAHTSSASTKLIHGGLRYLEYGEFRLVQKALAEREVLLAAAPHISWPLRFVLPHEPHLRPAWIIRIGLFLYDHLARRHTLSSSQTINLAEHPTGEPLRRASGTAFMYSDAWVDDARLVVLNAIDAQARGAQIHTRTRCKRLELNGHLWQATLTDSTQRTSIITARSVINATGPWAGIFLEQCTKITASHAVRLVKGSHIVVPALFSHDCAYLFQNSDKRIIFAIPYEQHYTLIGTTDVDYEGDPAAVKISAAEELYLCSVARHYFKKTITSTDIIYRYAGVRPLLKDEALDPASVTRDYSFELDTAGAPLLTVLGGKLTTYRRLAEEALAHLQPLLGNQKPGWTHSVPLPGGDLGARHYQQFHEEMSREYPAFPKTMLDRWCRAYGTRLKLMLNGARTLAELGVEVLPELYDTEIRYLVTHEWARTAEDILWRRSKLGLHLPKNASHLLDHWLADYKNLTD
jgi:glycerol-3-phosphate dehydrogenase